MMASPLILGNDIRKLCDNPDSEVLKILKNKELIAINQDPLGRQAVRYKRTPKADYLFKPMSENRAAICLFNRKNKTSDLHFSSSDIPDWNKYANLLIRDIFSAETVANECRISVPAHGCVVFMLE